jgi:hypothetical protein
MLKFPGLVSSGSIDKWCRLLSLNVVIVLATNMTGPSIFSAAESLDSKPVEFLCEDKRMSYSNQSKFIAKRLAIWKRA